jgi:hypothetical protein
MFNVSSIQDLANVKASHTLSNMFLSTVSIDKAILNLNSSMSSGRCGRYFFQLYSPTEGSPVE